MSKMKSGLLSAVTLLVVNFFFAVVAHAAPCEFVPNENWIGNEVSCVADCNQWLQGEKHPCPDGTGACSLSAVKSDGECSSGQVCCMIVQMKTGSQNVQTGTGSQNNQPNSGTEAAKGASETKTKTASYDSTQCKVDGTSFSFPCPLGGGASKLPEIFGRIIKWIMGLTGALFFAMFVYGGFKYIIAGESAKEAEAGQKTLVNAVIGLAIVIGSYMLVSFVVETFNAGLGVNKPSEPAVTAESSGTQSNTQANPQSNTAQPAAQPTCSGNCLPDCKGQAVLSGTCGAGLKCCSDNPY